MKNRSCIYYIAQLKQSEITPNIYKIDKDVSL